MTEECEHDWRVDPNFILASYPPRSILMCADCKATKYGPWGKVYSNNPKDWEKASACNCRTDCKSLECDK